MFQFFLSVLVFFTLFFFLWDTHLPMLSSVKESWVWNKEGGFGTSAPKDGENPLKTLNGYRIENRYFSFVTNKFTGYEEPNRVDFALLAPGHIEYQKIGDEVNFFDDSGELFWKKSINSYPRSGYFSSPVLYLSGDNNTVFLLDSSGNRVGLGELNGRFLTDFDFDHTGKGAVVLFSGGEIYRIDEKGNSLYSLDLSIDRKESFFKSVSISPNGSFVAVHFSTGKKDSFLILDEKGEVTDEWETEHYFPHKVYLSIADNGNTLLNLPNSLEFYEDGKIVWAVKKDKTGSVYQAVFATGNGFVYGLDKEIVFLNADGKKIRTKTLPSTESPIRFFPGKDKNTFYLETKRDLYQLRIF
ncbi:hypothetical protein [Leptospira ilyithenensis]|uniref:WD40 repeat domain-containing protein n=1 Tax=Leptospira ilyithenensis TaxID=2484901 RepID=A0A4R9LMZ7_9LEPT|nr:hypothetical protein [Leptospira ilyithenensis]TGN10005.1 hypothetical protein EHS11_10595 [Leptospira ilyithenensis]